MIHSLTRRCGLAVALWLAVAGTALAAVDVNTADEAALTSLKGVGPATAKRIVDARGKGGPFKDAGDLAERVSGIGPKSVANLEQAGLTFGKVAAAPAKAAGKSAPKAAPMATPKAVR